MFGYLDCFSGVSGDKFLGAIIDAGVEVTVLCERLAALEVPGWELDAEEVRRGGLRATLVKITAAPDQPSRSCRDISRLLSGSSLPARAIERSGKAFSLLAEAEARVHGVPVEDVHFHEVGAVDSIIDIVGVAVGLEELGIDELWASPVCVGSGTVETVHGTLPVPAPATAELLQGVPTYAGPIESEMTTPTGAALLRALVSRYTPRPPAEDERQGYGAGYRDPSGLPNVLRLTVSERGAWDGIDEQVMLLESVIDHLSPEYLAAALDLVREAGALDVWQRPVVMKKGRLAVEVTVMTRPEDAPRLTTELMRQTGALGVRRTSLFRSVASRRSSRMATDLGSVLVKTGEAGGVRRTRAEADEVARIAREIGEGVADVAKRLSEATETAPPEDQSETE